MYNECFCHFSQDSLIDKLKKKGINSSTIPIFWPFPRKFHKWLHFPGVTPFFLQSHNLQCLQSHLPRKFIYWWCQLQSCGLNCGNITSHQEFEMKSLNILFLALKCTKSSLHYYLHAITVSWHHVAMLHTGSSNLKSVCTGKALYINEIQVIQIQPCQPQTMKKQKVILW